MSNTSKKFFQLHEPGAILRLPNAWDAGSARLFESQGAAAIATSSAGLSWSLGYQDGRLLPFSEVTAAVGRIARVLTVPLSVDIEHGYSDDPKKVAENVLRLIDLGAVGINLEDGSDNPSVLVSKISAIRDATDKAGVDLFINARSDVILGSLTDAPRQIEESIKRAKQYAEAGANGFFLPGLYKTEDIKAIVDSVSLPVNVLAWPGLPDAAELNRLGVRRISAGSGIAQMLWSTAETIAQEFLQYGRSAPFSSAKAYAKLQNLFANK